MRCLHKPDVCTSGKEAINPFSGGGLASAPAVRLATQVKVSKMKPLLKTGAAKVKTGNQTDYKRN